VPTRPSNEKRKDVSNAWSLDQSRKNREISGDYPEPGDLTVRAACERDFRLFCETYFPNAFNLAWSGDHIRAIGRMQDIVLNGGLFALAMPRGGGKTSLSVRAAIWALLYGHRRFVSLVAATEKLASDLMKPIKTELTWNERLMADFRQVCYPFKRLENNGRKCIGQIFDGEETRIVWSEDRLTLPTMPDDACDGRNVSGSTVTVAGITGALRGQSHTLATGEIIRPELILLDDPQTRESAMSSSQSETREAIIKGDVLFMGGPQQKIAAIMPCTVIRSGDLADLMLDRKKNPEWAGQKTKMVYSFPKHEKLWDEYRRIQCESLEADGNGHEATEFYGLNRSAMDEGAVVAWADNYYPDELSALQHAMNLKFRNERAFFAECQNDPMPAQESRPDDLTPDQIMARVNRMNRRQVLTSCSRITAFIDVQASLLWYVVCAWEDDFTGYVIDYGAYPEQDTAYFTLANARIPLSAVIKGAALEGQLYGGLKALTDSLCSREWPRDDGAALRLERCLIDANWPDSTDSVYKVCRQSAYSAVLTPSRGRYVGASSTPITEWGKQEGERRGLNWVLRPTPAYKSLRLAQYDANFFKSFIATRLSTAMGDKSALTLFGTKPQDHRMLADHLCSEFRVRTQRVGSTREVDEWKKRPEQVDNHLWDCLVGCAVAASIQGISLMDGPKLEKPKRPSFQELQRRAQEQRNRPPDQPRA
jgi:hypothetical protein